MKIALFYYDEFAEFEVVLIGLLFRQHEYISVALENREYRSEEGQRFCVDQVIGDVDVDSIDLLVIPGGEPEALLSHPELKAFIESLLARGKKVAGICGGADMLAGFGFLDGKKCTGMTSGIDPDLPDYRYYANAIVQDDQVVVDGNLITGQGQAYVEFAFELVRQMGGLGRSEEDRQEGIRWFKNIRLLA